MEGQLRRLGPNSKTIILKIPKECRTKIWLAGRGSSCQIYTKSQYASRQHFSITYRNQKYFLTDLQSANGTYLNDDKITCETVLNIGNLIGVGVPPRMQSSPDSIIYIFESHSDGIQKEIQSHVKNISTVPESNKSSESVAKKKDIVPMEVDPQQKQTSEQITNKSIEECKVVNETVQVVLNDSPSCDVVCIEPENSSADSFNTLRPAKRRKLDIVKTETVDKETENTALLEQAKPTEINIEKEDIIAYEALTQVDEPQVKSEPELLNYSLTEELIEISDSEEDWAPGLNLKQEGGKSPEGGDEDDDVVFLETIIRSPCKKDGLPPPCKVEGDLTETDIKWMGKLLKRENVVNEDVVHDIESEKPNEVDVQEKTGESLGKIDELVPCTRRLSRLSTDESYEPVPEPEPSRETFPRVEVPHKIVRKIVAKKSVSFSLVPEIRYFEVPSRERLTAAEVGRMRFTRIIYNICNWNTHWLEECKRVAPEKDPPDLCEERLRKIPRKFLCHSDYMKAFIPAMLLHLWNRIKEKWVASGESGFRQTMSCDSCEDYYTDNLTVYKCTGLVQSVDAHRQLVREGHLVLLRLHQIQLPQYTTPASEKYSKKLGYLVFGFVESKIYERFHNQKLHQSLAERTSAGTGDLHIVRLNILVKKRPSFKLDKQKLIQLTVVHHISQEIRSFKAVCFLPDSPLCSAILKPTNVEPILVDPPNKNLFFKGLLDDFQSEVVLKLSHACHTMSSLLYAVFGAAGTGKGQVIAALILQLLYGEEWKNKRPKIIYCTQWSIPLDEMVTKLKNCKQALGDKGFNLVRVGPIREVKPEVRDLAVSNLAVNLRNSNKRVLDAGKFDAEMEVMKEADVICTTCISSGISKMCTTFEKLLLRDRSRKVICIIDESMSCRETTSIVPLLLGVTHLILVGDIYQMEPTFSAEKTNALGLDMPLFWRIYKNFANVPKELWPIFIMRTQYRTEASLSTFLSELIYKTPLNYPSSSVTGKIGNLRSHLLLVDQAPESLAKGEKDTREIWIVSQLTKAILKLAKASGRNNLKTAVITCDSKQTENLQMSLPKTEFPELEIDKIQAFQGREFDLVVFTYDGRKMVNSWLTTALTRAKSGLFIFTSVQAIKGNSFFKKMADTAGKCDILKYVRSEMTAKAFEDIVSV